MTDAQLAALKAEVAQLRRWKTEASEVILGLQDLGRALGIPPGVRITGPVGTDAARSLSLAAAHLAHLVLTDARCDVLAGGDNPAGRGRCRDHAVAVRWENGFADLVCELHANNAATRNGALVIRPRRHDGTTT